MNSRTLQIVVGLLVLVAGFALVTAYADEDFGWIGGRTLGIALLVLGVFDIGTAFKQKPRP